MTPNMTQICSMPIGICLFLAALFGYEIFKRSHHHHHHISSAFVSISFNRYSVHAQGQDIRKARLGNLASFQGCLYGGMALTAALTVYTVRPAGTAVHPRCKWRLHRGMRTRPELLHRNPGGPPTPARPSCFP